VVSCDGCTLLVLGRVVESSGECSSSAMQHSMPSECRLVDAKCCTAASVAGWWCRVTSPAVVTACAAAVICQSSPPAGLTTPASSPVLVVCCRPHSANRCRRDWATHPSPSHHLDARDLLRCTERRASSVGRAVSTRTAACGTASRHPQQRRRQRITLTRYRRRFTEQPAISSRQAQRTPRLKQSAPQRYNRGTKA